jgi:predicted metal-dependent hydrolase
LEEKLLPLAVTVAIEHITAVLGAALLRGELFEGCAPEVVEFWKWHAVEEIEHKGVAFDFYVKLGGSPHLRRAVMAWAVFIMSIRLSSRMAHMLHHDGELASVDTWRQGARFLFGRNGFLRAMGKDFLAFFRADFHPWQHDDSALVAAWEGDHSPRAEVA